MGKGARLCIHCRHRSYDPWRGWYVCRALRRRVLSEPPPTKQSCGALREDGFFYPGCETLNTDKSCEHFEEETNRKGLVRFFCRRKSL